MTSFLPVQLVGDNLGERHHHLNRLVNDAYHQGIPFSSIQDLPEKSPLDRLFKIDLASKHKYVDFVLENLKHEDMLYVCRALKCTWLLDVEYSHLINPSYLERALYTEMTTTAVTKMKHWIELNLKDRDRCKLFYQYYIKNFDASIKFLLKCSQEFVLSELSKTNILEQIEPEHLKLLIEVCPDVAKVFFDSLETNENMLKRYLEKEVEYYNTLRFLLKVNGDDFLNIIEKYFCMYKFRTLNSEATKFVMNNYKARFEKKPELYTAWLLDMKSLAKHLTKDEVKDLILKLARAEYLHYWFSYKNVEPLIKRLSIEERTRLKKVVFVDKAFGDMIKEWPYETPSSPEVKDTGNSVFDDKEHNPREYENIEETDFRVRKIRKKKGSFEKYEVAECMMMKCANNYCLTRKSSLDLLFDRYRFVSFEKTLYDLQKQMMIETLQHRQNIMLVLISKSGGRAESVEHLLNILTTRHENEPEHVRATAVRSLVRRCSAWRLPENVWNLLLKFGRGIGLDGTPSTVACREGLHAVIIRHILNEQEIDPAVWKAFMEDFSTLKDYSLNAAERQIISTKLPGLLVAAAKDEPLDAADRLEKALDCLDAYEQRADQYPHMVTVISEIAHNRDSKTELLLWRLFDARIARKELFKANFTIIQNNASYYNALKHDISVLTTGELFETLITSNKLAHQKFIRALALYFNEKDGLAQTYLSLLKKHVRDEKLSKHEQLRYIAILSKEVLLEMIQETSDAPKKTHTRRIAAALRANCHLARPLINLNEFDWRSIGVKAIANRVLKCSLKHVDLNINVLLTWSRTQKLALILAMRTGQEAKLIKVTGEKRSRLALKTALHHSNRNKLDEAIWDIIIPFISQLNEASKINDRLRKLLSNVGIVPANKKAKYCMTVFEVFQKQIFEKICRYKHLPMLCYIENILPEVEEEFIESIITSFIAELFNSKKFATDARYSYKLCTCLHIRIVAKYLLLCKSDTDVEKKWENIGKPFFDNFEQVWISQKKESNVINYLEEFLLSLKYTKIFLNTDYLCLPMMQRITNRIQSFIPLHRYYDKYIHLHLTMIYFKSLRLSIKNNPVVFDNLPKNLNSAAEVVGRTFGKLIANELIELVDKYFDSVTDIYKVELVNFLGAYFESGESKNILISNVVKSLLEHQNATVLFLAEHIYQTDGQTWPNSIGDEVFETLNRCKNIQVQLALNAHLYPW